MLCLSRCVKVCGQSKSCHFFFVLCVFLIFFEEATIFETCSSFSQSLFPDNNPFIFVGNRGIFSGAKHFWNIGNIRSFFEDWNDFGHQEPLPLYDKFIPWLIGCPLESNPQSEENPEGWGMVPTYPGRLRHYFVTNVYGFDGQARDLETVARLLLPRHVFDAWMSLKVGLDFWMYIHIHIYIYIIYMNLSESLLWNSEISAPGQPSPLRYLNRNSVKLGRTGLGGED